MSEWDILVLYHVTYLFLHGDKEEYNKVHNKDGPEYRNIEEIKESTEESDQDSPHCTVPELKLWQLTHKRSELFTGLCG